MKLIITLFALLVLAAIVSAQAPPFSSGIPEFQVFDLDARSIVRRDDYGSITAYEAALGAKIGLVSGCSGCEHDTSGRYQWCVHEDNDAYAYCALRGKCDTDNGFKSGSGICPIGRREPNLRNIATDRKYDTDDAIAQVGRQISDVNSWSLTSKFCNFPTTDIFIDRTAMNGIYDTNVYPASPSLHGASHLTCNAWNSPTNRNIHAGNPDSRGRWSEYEGIDRFARKCLACSTDRARDAECLRVTAAMQCGQFCQIWGEASTGLCRSDLDYYQSVCGDKEEPSENSEFLDCIENEYDGSDAAYDFPTSDASNVAFVGINNEYCRPLFYVGITNELEKFFGIFDKDVWSYDAEADPENICGVNPQ